MGSTNSKDSESETIGNKSALDPLRPKVWKARHAHCLGMIFEMKQDVDFIIYGIELRMHFGGVNCYGILAQFNQDHGFENQSVHKLEMAEITEEGTRFRFKDNQCIHLIPNMKYKLGFVISDGHYCNNYYHKDDLDVDHRIHPHRFSFKMLNTSKLLNSKTTNYEDGEHMDWFPKLKFIETSANEQTEGTDTSFCNTSFCSW